MTYMLDTDTCIECLRGNPLVLQRLHQIDPAEIALSVVTACELAFGAAKSTRPKTPMDTTKFISRFTVVGIDQSISNDYAQIRFQLESAGTPIGANDLFLAAHARCLGLTLVSNNLREFRRVSGLTSESWK